MLCSKMKLKLKRYSMNFFYVLLPPHADSLYFAPFALVSQPAMQENGFESPAQSLHRASKSQGNAEASALSK